MRRDLALVGAFSGLRVELASGDHGRCTSSGGHADPCAEIRSAIGTRTGRRKRRDGGVGWLHWLGRWWRGAANAAIDTAKHVAAFVVMLAGAALVGAGANRLAAKAIRRADARSAWRCCRRATEEGVSAAGIFRAGVAGAAAQRFSRIGAVADTIGAAFALAAVLIGLAGLPRFRGAFAGRIASSHWRHADARIAGILTNAAAEVRTTVTGSGAADKARATIPWPGWIFTSADTAHAASDAAAVIFFAAYVTRCDAERWRLAADRRIRANA